MAAASPSASLDHQGIQTPNEDQAVTLRDDRSAERAEST
jgi:hypothetical protein